MKKNSELLGLDLDEEITAIRDHKAGNSNLRSKDQNSGWLPRGTLPQARQMKAKILRIEGRIDKFLNRLVERENPIAIKRFEEAIPRLEEEKLS